MSKTRSINGGYVGNSFIVLFYYRAAGDNTLVRHVTGTESGLLGGIPRVVVQISALTLKGPL